MDRRPASEAANAMRGLSAAAMAMLLSLVLILPADLPAFAPSVALADDHGGGGDDGGGDDDGGGRDDDDDDDNGVSSRDTRSRTDRVKERRQQQKVIKKKAAQKKAVQKKPVKKAVRASRPVIVALDLSDSALGTLRRRGYAVLSDNTLSATRSRVTRLRTPANVSSSRARAAVVRLGASSADLNTFYRPQDINPCEGETECRVRGIVGWPDGNLATCTASPRIGLVETHLDLKHPALAGQTIEMIDVKPKDRAQSRTDHGTGIASLLVGAEGSVAEGLLPSAELVVATPFYKANDGDRAEAADLIRAIDAVVARNPDVLNLSLAGPPNAALEKVLEAVQAKGIPVVAAAGNGGARSKPLYPAAYDTTFAVTAVTPKLDIFRRATRGAHVDVAAPGVEVVVAGQKGTTRKTGTSFAAPFVAASLAILRDADPQKPLPALYDEITRRTRDLGKPGRDPVFGWGLLDASGLCNAQTGVSYVPAAEADTDATPVEVGARTAGE